MDSTFQVNVCCMPSLLLQSLCVLEAFPTCACLYASWSDLCNLKPLFDKHTFSSCITWITSFLPVRQWIVVSCFPFLTGLNKFNLPCSLSYVPRLVKIVSFFLEVVLYPLFSCLPNHCVKSVRIRSYYGLHFPAFGLNTEILHTSPHSARMRENTDQNNSEYGHFSRSKYVVVLTITITFSLLISYKA